MPEHALSEPALPGFDAVLAAAARIAPFARVTAVLRSQRLDALAGAELFFKCEHQQRGGAFKFRGACNAVQALDAESAARGVATHSSGNHGAALALAAKLRGIACHVVVPEGANPAKLEAIRRHGATLHRCAPGIAARESACADVQRDTGATLVHPYADARVIAGQGTAALELFAQAGELDLLVVPVGGGGLASGSALSLAARSPRCGLLLAEPADADDTLRSLREGERRTNAHVPATVCDGLRGDLGAPDFELLHAARAEAIAVEDAATLAAMRELWADPRLRVEPSSAIALAAVLAQPERVRGRRIGIVLSGGNIDLATLPALLAIDEPGAA
ncbi:MAG TPA: pyridoxal-phosphate dependent enzyme [Lysobacter sp.]|nr:pyridoxal-phosphate dependent enzyme [Lysobacter sp.]